MNVPATSWSKEIVNGSSATTVGTTVITYSQSEIPNKESNSVVNKPTANTATTHNVQNTTVINNNNNHSANQGGVTVVENNSIQAVQSSNNVENNQLTANGQNAQNSKNDNGNNSNGSHLPQTGEAGASALIVLGVILIVGSTIVFYIKQR